MRNEVCPTLGMVQHILASRSGSSNVEVVQVHVPPIVLPKANFSTLADRLSKWMFVLRGGVGQFWHGPELETAVRNIGLIGYIWVKVSINEITAPDQSRRSDRTF
jgi:hypothetical protein